LSQNHKIAKALEELIALVNSALNHATFAAYHSDLMLRANSAISFLVHLFLCPKCEGSGEIMNPAYYLMHKGETMIECPDCQGTGIKTDILDRLEAEDITDEYTREKNKFALQGSGDGNKGH
jgi:excinuclease UvrABC ATPase subunit